MIGSPDVQVTILDDDSVGGTLDGHYGAAQGASAPVHSSVVQDDGKVIIAGDFTLYNLGVPTKSSRIARLNVDGSQDDTFGLGVSGPNQRVSTLAIDRNQNPLLAGNVGKVIVGGQFTSINGTTRNRIARLNTDGSLDTSFAPGVGPNNEVFAVAVQNDGKVLIGGSFSTVAGQPNTSGLARLNENGTLDTSFNLNIGASLPVHSILIQTDGKIVVGGEFTQFNGVNVNRIVRLNADGSLDTSFDPGTGANGTVRSLALDGSDILLGGDFSGASFGASITNKSLSGGTAVLTATSPHGFVTGDVIVVSIGDSVFDGIRTVTQSDSDTRTIEFTAAGSNVSTTPVSPTGSASVVNRPVNRLAKLSGTTGALIASFSENIGGGPNAAINTVLKSGSHVIVGGNHSGSGFGAVVTRKELDAGTDKATLTTKVAHGLAVGDVVTVSGVDSTFNGTYRITEVNVGARTFSYTIVTSTSVSPVAVNGPGYATAASRSHNRITRLNADGSVDTTADFGSGFNNEIRTLIVDASNGLLVGGLFTEYDGMGGSGIDYFLRLANTGGTFDAGYNNSRGLNAAVQTLAIDLDGKIVAGGDFTDIHDEPLNSGIDVGRTVRLDAGGSYDSSFLGVNAGSGSMNDTVRAVAIDRNTDPFLTANRNKVVIEGTFTSAQNPVVSRNRIARLNTDGTLDTTLFPEPAPTTRSMTWSWGRTARSISSDNSPPTTASVAVASRD